MLTARTDLVARGIERFTLAASPSHSQARFLVDQVLATLLRRAAEHHLLPGRVPIGDDGLVLGSLLQDGGPPAAALFLLGLGLLGRASLALLAAGVLAAGTFFGGAEGVAALVALAVNAHADGLLDAEGVALGGIPLAGLDLQAEAFTELLGAVLIDLGPGYLGRLRDKFGVLGGLCIGCTVSRD